MKRTAKKLTLALLSTAFLMSGCNNDDDDDPAPVNDSPKNIVEIASADTTFSILVSALSKANLVSTLDDSGPFTVFAPTNTAFRAAGYTKDVIEGMSEETVNNVLKPILLYHVISGNIKSTDLTTGYVTPLATGGSSIGNAAYSMYISTASGVKINNGPMVTTADVSASNGVIHVVDGVITLPTIATFVTADPNFSTLATAATGANLVDDVLDNAEYGPVTVFAPTNTAFANASITGTEDQSTLSTVVRGHVVDGNVRSASLTNGQTIAPLNESYSIKVNKSETAVSLDVTNGTSDANVTAVDVQATNGVVHVIDKVLLLNL